MVKVHECPSNYCHLLRTRYPADIAPGTGYEYSISKVNLLSNQQQRSTADGE